MFVPALCKLANTYLYLYWLNDRSAPYVELAKALNYSPPSNPTRAKSYARALKLCEPLWITSRLSQDFLLAQRSHCLMTHQFIFLLEWSTAGRGVGTNRFDTSSSRWHWIRITSNSFPSWRRHISSCAVVAEETWIARWHGSLCDFGTAFLRATGGQGMESQPPQVEISCRRRRRRACSE